MALGRPACVYGHGNRQQEHMQCARACATLQCSAHLANHIEQRHVSAAQRGVSAAQCIPPSCNACDKARRAGAVCTSQCGHQTGAQGGSRVLPLQQGCCQSPLVVVWCRQLTGNEPTASGSTARCSEQH